jgi:hypothetical protein
MLTVVRGARIVDFVFSTELVAANTHPTGAAIALKPSDKSDRLKTHL